MTINVIGMPITNAYASTYLDSEPQGVSCCAPRP